MAENQKITTAAAALALLAGLAGCSPFPSPPPPDIAPATPVSVLPPECPFVGQNDLTPVRIPLGTPRETIGSVLNAYSGWLNAGSDRLAGILCVIDSSATDSGTFLVINYIETKPAAGYP